MLYRNEKSAQKKHGEPAEMTRVETRVKAKGIDALIDQ